MIQVVLVGILGFVLPSTYGFIGCTGAAGKYAIIHTHRRPLAASISSTIINYPESSSPLHLAASTASDELNRLLNERNNDDDNGSSSHHLVALEGYISGRRALGSSLLFVDIVLSDDDNDSDENLVYIQALLKRDIDMTGSTNGEENDDDDDSSSSSFSNLFNVYFKVLQPGARVRLVGRAGPANRSSESLLFIQSVKFLAPNNNPQHLKNVLRFAMSGDLPRDDIARALSMESTAELAVLLELRDDQKATDQYFFLLAKEVLASHPNKSSLLDPTQLSMNNSDKSGSAATTSLPPANRDIMMPPDWVRNATMSTENDGDVFSSLVVADGKSYSTRNALVKYDSSTTVDDDDFIANDKPISLVGWVRNRRRYQNSITVLDVVDNVGEDETRIECLLNPDIFRSSGNTNCEIYGQLLCAGSRVMMHGFTENQKRHANEDGQCAIRLWVTHAKIIRSSWRPGAIQYLLELLHSSNISVVEAANALELPGGEHEAESLSRISDHPKLRWKAAEISRTLQDASSRMGKVTPELEQVLDQYSALRDTFPASADDNISADSEVAQRQSKTLPLTYGDVLLRSRYEVKKKPQVEWMIRQIEDVIQSHPGERPLRVVDIGGGKGYLANAIAQYFGSEVVNVRVLDVSFGAVMMGRKIANRSSIDNVRFDIGDAAAVDLSGSVDLVVSLHGCGVLTDVAIGHAISSGAAFVVCPCCFRSNPSLQVTAPFVEAAAHQQRNAKRNQLLSASEWLKMDSNDHEKLKRLAEIQGDINLSSKAIHTM